MLCIELNREILTISRAGISRSYVDRCLQLDYFLPYITLVMLFCCFAFFPPLPFHAGGTLYFTFPSSCSIFLLQPLVGTVESH